MHIFILIAGVVAAVAFFVVRAYTAYGLAKDINRGTKPLQHKTKQTVGKLIGTRLSRIRDPQLAAAILAIQLIRAERPLSAREKVTLVANLRETLRVSDPDGLFAQAWDYTQNNAFFSLTADELLPLLRARLTVEERDQLMAVLTAVASAESEISTLQRSSLARLKKRLFV